MKPEQYQRKQVIVVGGGTAGISLAASLNKRDPGLNITVIEPSDNHFYQPAWTLVGAGLYDINKTKRKVHSLLAKKVKLIKDSVVKVDATERYVSLKSGIDILYDILVLATGVQLDWDSIPGAKEALGRNGVTSNYDFKSAPYTWEAIKSLTEGNVIFTQPAMPIKCAGAPQKALYLSCDYWRRKGILNKMNVFFRISGETLFGVQDFLPQLHEYMQGYDSNVIYKSRLIRVDGPSKRAWFVNSFAGRGEEVEEVKFDILHITPPQKPSEFIKESALGDDNGWCDVDPIKLVHKRYPTVFSIGDCTNTPNSKTAAAARKQVVVACENIISTLSGIPLSAKYDGYGSCPLTVERGKVLLAEFGYENRLLPSFPMNPLKPNRFAWYLTTKFLPVFYWYGMLRGIEWYAKSSKGT